MADPIVPIDPIEEEDPELEERLRQSYSGPTLTHEEVWERIAKRCAALRTLKEQMRTSAS
jgi:hypothetical protein